MIIHGQHFSRNLVERINAEVINAPEMSRRELSLRVCGWMHWRSANGQWKEMSCRKALLELERRQEIVLPAVKGEYAYQRKGGSKTEQDVGVAKVRGELGKLGEVSVEPIESRWSGESKVWRALLDRYHYLGSGQRCGSQIRYLIRSEKYGYVGAAGFRSGSWALRARDEYIGWSEGARRTHLKQVVCNDRFLIVPTVRVDNLATHALGLLLKRLPEDWESRYKERPVLAETFVDAKRFRGTCYRAGNWKEVGESSGRRDGQSKKVFVYPLRKGWQRILCEEPKLGLGTGTLVEEPADWAEEEFGSARVYDPRLKRRLYTVAQDFYKRPQANIPEACGSKAGALGAYRLINNGKVTMDIVLEGHTEATVKRIGEHAVVLAPQDTTEIRYTHPATEGLGPLNTKKDKAMGLVLHDTLAFTEAGTPLGVLDAQCWARDPEDRGKSSRRKQLPIEQKESMKWLRSYHKVAQVQRLCPQTTLVSIGDRESDIYELFLEAHKEPNGPKLLVRAERTRKRRVESEQEHLWEYMGRQPVGLTLKIRVPRRGSQKARDALIDIRFAKAQLQPPKSTKYPALEIWGVYVLEQKTTAQDNTPVEWMLLTTAEVNSPQAAQQRVEWYSGRWGIEVYHRTLKTCCRIKDRQLETADGLQTCLGIDMVVAWRVYHLAMLGRETPNLPCTVFFQEVEWKALWCYVYRTPTHPETAPTIREAVLLVGRIGGHLGRKSDGYPGTQVLARALPYLDAATQMYCILTEQRHAPDSMKSGP